MFTPTVSDHSRPVQDSRKGLQECCGPYKRKPVAIIPAGLTDIPGQWRCSHDDADFSGCWQKDLMTIEKNQT